jgi:hypothetical protein
LLIDELQKYATNLPEAEEIGSCYIAGIVALASHLTEGIGAFLQRAESHGGELNSMTHHRW